MNEAEKERKAEVMRKISKLLNMTTENGAAQQEAETAARIARKLLDEWQLSIADVKLGTLGEEVGEVVLAYAPGAANEWQAYLLQAVALGNGCRVVWCKDEGVFRLVGFESDREVVKYFYVYLAFKMAGAAVEYAERARVLAGRKQSSRQRDDLIFSFIVGAGEAVKQRFLESRQPSAAATTSETTAIVAVDALKAKQVAEWMQAKFGRLSSRAGRSCDSNARAAGNAAGRSVALNAGVTSAAKGGQLRLGSH